MSNLLVNLLSNAQAVSDEINYLYRLLVLIRHDESETTYKNQASA